LKKEIIALIKARKEIYKSSPEDMISAYNREIETQKEYNGRQLLELLQNADDEKSEKVEINLNTIDSTLIVSNVGSHCTPFSIDGIKSLMISNLSSKLSKKYIGNKGLGFRSIVNWAENISILSNNLEIEFSRKVVENQYDSMFNKTEHYELINKRKLPENVKPIPFLSLPRVKDKYNKNWTTSINIKYKSMFEEDIIKQIHEIKKEISLFLNHVQEIVIIQNSTIIKEIKKEELLKEWTIYQKGDILDKEYWDKENEEEKYDLRIAINKSNKNYINELFSYFPTKVDIRLPYIVHGTFELNSSRNEINDSKKNRFILLKLVELIGETAKLLSSFNVNYKALEMLSYTYKNNILEAFGFYNNIDRYIESADIFPCLDGTYRSKDNVIYSEGLSQFIYKTKNAYFFPNLLIPNNLNIDLRKYNLKTSISNSKLNELSKNIIDIDERVNFIFMIYNSFNQFEEKLVFLIDSNNELVSINDEVYTPPNINISIPYFLKLKFIHKELYTKLIDRFNIIEKDKARELQRKLKEFTNIQSYEPAPIIQKIVSSTNNELKNKPEKKLLIVQEMIKALFENYLNLDIRTSFPTDSIQLLTKNMTLRNAKELYLSESYPSGKLTKYLFGDIFEEDLFLADNDILIDNKREDLFLIESFFIWLGVNKHTKFNKQTNLSYNEKINYMNYVDSRIGKINYRDISFDCLEISNLNDLINKMSPEKVILWITQDSIIKDYLNMLNKDLIKYSLSGEYMGTYRHSLDFKPSYIMYQIANSDYFKDFLIGYTNINNIINKISINYGNEQFLKYLLEKEEIEGFLLKLGATNKFENLSINTIKDALKNMSNKVLDGKNSQTFYKLCIKHYEKNNQSLEERDIKLFGYKGEEKKYFEINDLYYSGNIKLPKKITDTIPLLNFPKRGNTNNVINFFVIKNLNHLKVNVLEFNLNSLLTNSFKEKFEKIKPFIIVYRIKDSDEDSTKISQISKLKNLKIMLCDEVKYQISGHIQYLDDYDYLRENNNYYLKIPKDNEFNQLLQEFEFQETFADIIGLLYDIQETRVFRDLIKEDIYYTEKSIINDFGKEILIHSNELLGITDEIFSFWKSIYKIISKSFNFTSSKNLLNLVKNELNLKTNIFAINYLKLDLYESCVHLEELFTELSISPLKFNAEDTYYKIDFTKQHQRKIKQLFENSFISFRKKIYTWCIETKNEKDFINFFSKYEDNDDFIIKISKDNKLNINLDYEKFIIEFIYKNFEDIIDITPTQIDFESIYDKNVKQINIDDLNGEIKLLSLLYFEGKMKIILKYISNNKERTYELEKQNFSDSKKATQEKIELTSLNNIILEITNPILKTPIIGKSRNKALPFKHHSKFDINKKEIGESSEKKVFEKLIVEFGKENVVWSSKNNDNLGYDIKYKNIKNEWKFAEVKTFNGYQFNITKNEKEFAENHFGEYEIFLVGDKIYVLENVDFSDKTKFQLESNQYIVKYNI